MKQTLNIQPINTQSDFRFELIPQISWNMQGSCWIGRPQYNTGSPGWALSCWNTMPGLWGMARHTDKSYVHTAVVSVTGNQLPNMTWGYSFQNHERWFKSVPLQHLAASALVLMAACSLDSKPVTQLMPVAEKWCRMSRGVVTGPILMSKWQLQIQRGSVRLCATILFWCDLFWATRTFIHWTFRVSFSFLFLFFFFLPVRHSPSILSECFIH